MSEIETSLNGRRIQTQVLPVSENTIAIRSLDWDRDRFDIEFGLENGTTYNSFLILGEKTALVDASHEKFTNLYMTTLKNELAKLGRKVDYVLVSHTEPDHSFLIPKVVELYPDAIVCGSKVALAFLQNLTHVKMNQKVVKGGDKVDLGNGHVIEFVMAPNLHWPDTMFSFDHATNIMYTCDAFGMHYCTEEPYDANIKDIKPHYQFYYDCLMKPNAKSVTTALRKVKDLPYNLIATGHGPLLRYNVPEMVNYYRSWSEAALKQATGSVAVLYASDYGYSDRLSQCLARGITKAGVATEMVDLISVDPQELLAVVGRNQGVVIMAPPSDCEDARTSLAALTSAIKPKTKFVVAESYGGRDEPVDFLETPLVAVGAQPVCKPLRVTDTPCPALYQLFEETGTDLAQALSSKEVIAKKKAAMSNDVALALGKLATGLYVVTAARAGARSAMIASWVSQASFEPLGLSIAVAKDRAIESFLQVGDSFALNVLGEDSFQPVMKHFLKRFPPGADRFEGVNTFEAKNGAPVLKDSISYMECKVTSRLDANDHWILYCEVANGEVIKADARTAVHRRKVANYY